MGLHKLAAGGGYTYLTRQTVALDATHRGRIGLAEYYAARGELPGSWIGSGLSGVLELATDLNLDIGFAAGGPVTAEQMLALFGQGRHPDALRLELALRATGRSEAEIRRATALGTAFPVYAQNETFRDRCAEAFTAHNRERGLPERAPVPEADRAVIRTRVAAVMFAEVHGRSPLDEREFTGFLAKVSRPARSAVAGYDLTFSPVKSVSTLWALAPVEVAEVIAGAHADAVADTVGWLEKHAVFTRQGRDGVRQVETRGLIAAAFTHRDSRAGDPDLHTHVAVSNKVQTLGGQWLALDGRMLYQNKVTASEHYNTRLEALLVERLGLTFTERPGTTADRRPVREITGIDPWLLAAWSSRRQAITRRTGELAGRFQAEHHRAPTPVEALALGQQATLETRQAKHEPRALADQRAAWRAEAAALLGSPDAVDQHTATVLHRSSGLDVFDGLAGPDLHGRGVTPGVTPTGHGVTPGVTGLNTGSQGVTAAQDVTGRGVTGRESISQGVTGPSTVSQGVTGQLELTGVGVAASIGPTATAVIDRLEADRATWQPHHVRSEAERQARRLAVTLGEIDGFVEQVVTTALSATHSVALTGEVSAAERALLPAALRRSDGVSVYEVAGSRRYTSPRILAAERTVLAAADRTTGRRLTPHAAQVALLEVLANGTRLNRGQAHLVQQLACSGARVQLALAPAGTGKTTALRALAAAWTGSGGTVIGLAPSAAAAGVLRDELADHAAAVDTLAKLLHTVGHDDGTSAAGLARRIDAGTLVLVDEAGMASTPDLAALVELAAARGASVRLIGDDRQLAAVGAGGLLRDLATHPATATLTEVVRFRDPVTGAVNHAEAAASQAIRAGDPAGIAYYTDHQRIHIGTSGPDGTAVERAYAAWAEDRARGMDAVLLAPTREQVHALNQRARADRITGMTVRERGPERQLTDGSHASAGDVILTRRNDRRLSLDASDWVKNGDRFTVTRVHPDGALSVRQHGSGTSIVLPAGYVGEHVQLGYASTIHTAQGSTADVAHAVLSGTETRELLYVALTRGRHANHLYLATAPDGDPHTTLRPETVRPVTAVETLTGMLEHTDDTSSATTAQAEEADPFRRLGQLVARWDDAISVAVDQILGPENLGRLELLAEQAHPGLTDQPAWPALRDLLAHHAADGHAPDRLLHLGLDDLEGARDVAAVAHARISRHLDPPGYTTHGRHGTPRMRVTPDPETGGPRPAEDYLPWLTTPPRRLQHHPDWAAYLDQQRDHLATAAAEVVHATQAWTPVTAPIWAAHLASSPARTAEPGRHPIAVAELAVWRAAHQIPDTDPRPTGPTPRTETRTHQLNRRHLTDSAEHIDSTATALHRHLSQSGHYLFDDPSWPALADHVRHLQQQDPDIWTTIRQHIDSRPLPDEQPAAALRWRLAGTTATDNPEKPAPAEGKGSDRTDPPAFTDWDCAIAWSRIPEEHSQTHEPARRQPAPTPYQAPAPARGGPSR